MKGSWIILVAARYFKTRRKEKGYASTIVSTGGIAVGVMALISVLAVMNGFQQGFIGDILEISSYHLQLHNPTTLSESKLIELTEDVEGVEAVVPFIELQAMVSNEVSQPRGCLIRAVPKSAFQRDSGFSEHLELKAGSYFDSYTPGEGPPPVLIGAELSQNLNLVVGDQVSIFFLSGMNKTQPQGEQRKLTVGGIFRSGYYDFDLGWAFMPLEAVQAEGIDSESVIYGVKLKNRFQDSRVAERIRTLLPAAKVESWRSFNQAFFSALRMEKLLMTVLLGLIFLVVGVNSYHSLKRSVIERTEEIGALKTFGAPPLTIRSIFVAEGLMIGLGGGLLGVILGFLVSINVNALFRFAEGLVNSFQRVLVILSGPLMDGTEQEIFTIFSPQYFYLTDVPIRLLPGEVAGIFLAAVAASVLAAFAASRAVAVIHPKDVMRYE
ncbi:MAG: ABC transporter permease [Spirochaetales bacterium]|nr:ABC transporter permease [Spirochaetales bacterium]MCF7937136.1 ABC transporter permease [Spirochaetales bacterium]